MFLVGNKLAVQFSPNNCRLGNGKAGQASSSKQGVAFKSNCIGGKNSLAFTLLELLVVISIIGILAAISLPAIRGFGQTNAMSAANRQLLDDLASARLRAIVNRTTIYVVFVPQTIDSFFSRLSGKDLERATNLLSGQFTSYALFARHNVGDQPGKDFPRYLTPWKHLPEGVFIAQSEYEKVPTNIWNQITDEHFRPFAWGQFPFPTAASPGFDLPYIAFDAQGRVRGQRDEVIALARGSIFYARDQKGRLIPGQADVLETPPNNSIQNSNHVHVDWLTGRAKVERLEVK